MKRSTIGLAILASLASAPLFAAGTQAPQHVAVAAEVRQPERLQFHEQYGTAEIVTGEFAVPGPAAKEAKALGFLTDRKEVFRITEPPTELRLLSERTDDLGLSHLRFQQQYGGVPVWGCQTIVHFKGDNVIYLVGGQIIPTPSINTTPAIGAARARDEALQSLKDQYDPSQLRAEAELVIYPGESDPRLAQLVTVTSPTNGAVRWRVFVDAQTSRILHQFNDIHFDGPDTGTGLDVLGHWVTFPIYDFSGTFQMVDVTRTMYNPPAGNLDGVIVTYEDYYDGGPISTDPDNDKWWDDNAGQKAAVSGHVNTAATYEYFLNTHGRDSYDGLGSTILVNVHDSVYVNNAYWNGEAINFADGDGVNFLPFSGSLDVVAHELAHGVTEYNGHGGLIYRFQSGALNESYSDFFGSMVDSADLGWLLGEDITLFSPGFIRSMKDPNTRGHPKHMDEYQYLDISTDGGGVHINSGIPNHAAYRASDIHGLGRDTVEQIWYRTLTTYMTPSSGFYFWAGMTIQSAIDLYGASSSPVTGVEAALGDVGLGTAYAMPQTASVAGTLGHIANQNVWIHNPGTSLGQVTVSSTSPGIPGVTISPPSQVISDADSAAFVLTLDATGLDECDVGTTIDTLSFTAAGAYTTEIRVPVTVSVGYTAASIESELAITSCVTLDVANTTNMDRFERDGNDALYDASLLVGLVNFYDTTTYRDFVDVQSFAAVDTIASEAGLKKFRIASEDARIQGEVTYTWSGQPDSCEFIIADYSLYNLCDTPLTVLAGLVGDFDIDNSMSNRVGYNASKQLVYMENSGNTRACGLALLSDTARNLRAINNPSQVWGGAFTDGLAYREMAQTANLSGSSADDWSMLLTFGQTQLGPGDTATYTVALMYSNTGSGALDTLVDKALAWLPPPGCCANRGNTDGIIGVGGPIDVADLTYLVDYLFVSGPVPPCDEEGNVDSIVGVAGPIDIADLTYLVDFLFQAGPAPPPCP